MTSEALTDRVEDLRVSEVGPRHLEDFLAFPEWKLANLKVLHLSGEIIGQVPEENGHGVGINSQSNPGPGVSWRNLARSCPNLRELELWGITLLLHLHEKIASDNSAVNPGTQQPQLLKARVELEDVDSMEMWCPCRRPCGSVQSV